MLHTPGAHSGFSSARAARAASASLVVPASPLLLLASASPRRAQILQTLGIPFRIVSSAFQETPPRREDHADPVRFVESLAYQKARGCGDRNALSLVLTADTIVWHDGQILGKPHDEDDAVQMLQRLRGSEHRVFTGVCLRWTNTRDDVNTNQSGEFEYSIAHEITTVRFRDVSDAWIRAYVATGEPMDKAGSYGAQGKGAVIVERIEGDFWNVVGLPLKPLRELLEKAGAPIESFWQPNEPEA